MQKCNIVFSGGGFTGATVTSVFTGRIYAVRWKLQVSVFQIDLAPREWRGGGGIL
jgi:hypothetical protein